MNWRYQAGNWVLWPVAPKAMIHFLGGAFVATLPHTTYQRLLFTLARQGYGIIATPFLVQFDHQAIALDIKQQFLRTYDHLTQQDARVKQLPIFGLGHSMGCKLHLLLASSLGCDRQGNILISFNNFNSDQSIPFAGWLRDTLQSKVLREVLEDQVFQDVFQDMFQNSFSLEFSPSPQQTLQLIQSQYNIQKNLLIQFSADTLDQTTDLNAILSPKFSTQVVFSRLSGNHLTPLGQDIPLGPSSGIVPFDVIGQWFHQEVYREIHHLEQGILGWLKLQVSSM